MGSRATTQRPSGDRWDLLLICVAGLVATAVGRLHMAIPGLSSLRPVLVLGVATVALYLLDATPARRLHPLFRGPVPALCALAAWMALGIPTALVGYRTLSFVLGFLKTVLIFLVVAGAVRHVRDVERLAWAYFASAAGYAAVVVTQFELGAGAWRLSNLMTYDANDFAILVVTALPLGVASILRPGRVPLWRAADACGLVLLAVTFVWAGSRGGFLALIVSGAYFLARYRGVGLPAKLASVVAVGAVVAVVAGPQFWSQMQTILRPEADYNVTGTTGRLQIWKRGLGYMVDRPFLGVGANNFGPAEGTLSSMSRLQEYGIGVRWSAPHNAFVQVGAETGLPGLAFYTAFLVLTFVTLSRARRSVALAEADEESARAQGLADSLATALVGFVVGSFFLSLAYASMVYVLAALALGLEKTTALRRSFATHGTPVGWGPGRASATDRNANSAIMRRSFSSAPSSPR
jgi:O-antigen ligase